MPSSAYWNIILRSMRQDCLFNRYIMDCGTFDEELKTIFLDFCKTWNTLHPSTLLTGLSAGTMSINDEDDKPFIAFITKASYAEIRDAAANTTINDLRAIAD